MDAYGADDVTAAYCAMAEFTINVATWNPTFVRIPVDQLTAADYDFLAPCMAAAGRAKLKDLAQRSMAEAERTGAPPNICWSWCSAPSAARRAPASSPGRKTTPTW